MSNDGRVCSLYELPEGFETLERGAFLCDLAIPAGAKIPEDLTVYGDMVLSSEVETLALKGLKVKGKIFAKSLGCVSSLVSDKALLITDSEAEEFKYKSTALINIYAGCRVRLGDRGEARVKVKLRAEPEVQRIKQNFVKMMQVSKALDLNIQGKERVR